MDGQVAPLDRNDVDTDALVPKQFLKSISRTGRGPFLFDNWRYLDRGFIGQDWGQRPVNPEFMLPSRGTRTPRSCCHVTTSAAAPTANMQCGGWGNMAFV